jgi:ABC-type glycerol-3-phosphate transport system permease component
MKRIKKNLAFEVFKNFYLFINVFIMLFPLGLMFFNTFKTHNEIATNPFGFSANSAENFNNNVKNVFLGHPTSSMTLTPFFTMLINSMIYTAGALIILMITGTMCSYCLGRFKFKFKRLVIFFIIMIQIIPFFGYMVPLFFNINRMGLLNSYIAVILVYCGVALPGTIIVMLGFFQAFPKDIEEAAIIDGCSEFRKFISIIIPIAKGIIASMMLINFMGFWNEFVIVSLLVKDSNMYPINVGVIIVKANQQGSGGHLDYIMTLLAMSALPNMIIFSVFQKQIVSGITLGSVKG